MPLTLFELFSRLGSVVAFKADTTTKVRICFLQPDKSHFFVNFLEFAQLQFLQIEAHAMECPYWHLFVFEYNGFESERT